MPSVALTRAEFAERIKAHSYAVALKRKGKLAQPDAGRAAPRPK